MKRSSSSNSMEQQQQHYTIEIPTNRHAFLQWYDTPRNKRLILHIAMLVWLVIITFMTIVLSLTANSEYRVAFYLSLILFMSLFYMSTYWLFSAVRQEILVKLQQESTIVINETQ